MTSTIQEQTPNRIKKKIEDSDPDSASEPGGSDRAFEPFAQTPHTWVLGLDIGTTGISAVLLHPQSHRLYPLYWQLDAAAELGPTAPPQGVGERWFRLPVSLSYRPGALSERSLTLEPLGANVGADSASLGAEPPGPEDLTWDDPSLESPTASALSEPLTLSNLRPLLTLGLPHQSPKTGQEEPVIQWNEYRRIPLQRLGQGMQLLLSSLTTVNSPSDPSPAKSPKPDTYPICAAVGLSRDQTYQALKQIRGVMIGQPTGWPDAYRINIREAVLAAGIVHQAEQVHFMDEAIATLLSGLRSADGAPIHLSPRLPQRRPTTDWHGPTLVLNAGAAVTSLALVNLPDDPTHLSIDESLTRSFPYGGHAIDQDILCQLLYPLWREEHIPETEDYSLDWPALDPYVSLNLQSLSLPRPGALDLDRRQRLQQRLNNTPLGERVLNLARHVKIILQTKEFYGVTLDQQPYLVHRHDLGHRVLTPLIELLKYHIDDLLNIGSIHPSEVRQIVCSGGTASLRIIALWLRKRFARATIIQDTYSRSQGFISRPDRINTCSRVAHGLAVLPLHPHLLTMSDRPYTDYALLAALLQHLPDRPLSLDAICHLLSQHGIAVETCRPQLQRLLNGGLPAGIGGGSLYDGWLAPASSQRARLRSIPLFEQVDRSAGAGGNPPGVPTYRVIPSRRTVVRHHLNTLMAVSGLLTAP